MKNFDFLKLDNSIIVAWYPTDSDILNSIISNDDEKEIMIVKVKTQNKKKKNSPR